jgi:hypothetical protein
LSVHIVIKGRRQEQRTCTLNFTRFLVVPFHRSRPLLRKWSQWQRILNHTEGVNDTEEGSSVSSDGDSIVTTRTPLGYGYANDVVKEPRIKVDDREDLESCQRTSAEEISARHKRLEHKTEMLTDEKENQPDGFCDEEHMVYVEEKEKLEKKDVNAEEIIVTLQMHTIDVERTKHHPS